MNRIPDAITTEYETVHDLLWLWRTSQAFANSCFVRLLLTLLRHPLSRLHRHKPGIG
jgi:hypothetical protein